MKKMCNNCKYNYKSYHCLDCKSYDGDMAELQPFCSYCNYTKGSDPCTNCVWEEF